MLISNLARTVSVEVVFTPLDWNEPPDDLRAPALPDDAEAERSLERLGVDPEDRTATLAARPDPAAHPESWRVLRIACHELAVTMRAPVPIEGFAGWPPVPADQGAVGRHAYVWAYLAALPEVRRYHASKGIPDEISWTTLGVVGSRMRDHRRADGESGLGGLSQWSPPLKFRGAEYSLGRLDFNRVVIALSNGACGYALNTHIPATGPLDPAACDESFDRARTFFARHFPEEPAAFFTCSSWLLDPQLAEYLPASSNLVRFQRRFRLLPRDPTHDSRSDEAILRFVFDRPADGRGAAPEVLDELPQDTTLHRSYVAHLRSGGHWYSRTGWIPVSP